MQSRLSNLHNALGKPAPLDPESFAAGHRMLDRFLAVSLPSSFRNQYALLHAYRMPVPFMKYGVLWGFEFKDREEEAAPAATAFLWEARDCFIPVDFQSRTYSKVKGLAMYVTRKIGKDWIAAAALDYATTNKARDGYRFLMKLKDAPLPENFDRSRWEKILEAADQDGPGLINEVEKTLHQLIPNKGYFGLPYSVTPALAKNCEFFTVSAEKVVGLDPKWVGNFPEDFEQSMANRRVNQREEADRALKAYNRWSPPNCDANVEIVTAEARRMFFDRKKIRPWEEIWPPLNSECRRETIELFTQIQSRCGDFHVSHTWIDYHQPNSKLENVRVKRRPLAFYPDHYHYEILDRRGGSPRRTEILFSPERKFPRAGIDRLFLLDGDPSSLNRLNIAYEVHLMGQEAVEYLDFFCSAFHGPGGHPFHVIETLDDAEWRGLEENARNYLRDIINPIRLWPSKDKREGMVLDALHLYSGVLFHAVFEITPKGDVEKLEDTPLWQYMGVAKTHYSSKTHFLLRSPKDFQQPFHAQSKGLV